MKRFGIVFSTALLPMIGWGQSIVYDNTTTYLNNNFPLLPEWRDDSAEVGDEVWLAGTDRNVVQLSILIWYRGDIPGTLDARVRLRGMTDMEEPGDILYESPLYQSLATLHGMNEYTFDIPAVQVPDRFVWTIQVYNRQGSVGELGPAYFDPATVGYSADFFWQSDMGSPWTPYSWGGDPFANFGARIVAVPEPATCAALGLGLLALAIKRRVTR